MIPCETCSMFSCRYRRAPFKYARSKFENVRELQPLINKIIEGSNGRKFPLNADAKYSVNIKALQKWSDERLEINISEDGSISAKFRYNGTTCSNLGHELVFDYIIELGSEEEGFKIKSVECKPVGNGYTFMCDYKDDPDLLMNSINSEKPLLGKPLNEILNWERNFNPEGCYCKRESRDYKWGQVLETLHYKLVQIENSKSEEKNQTAETSAK